MYFICSIVTFKCIFFHVELYSLYVYTHQFLYVLFHNFYCQGYFKTYFFSLNSCQTFFLHVHLFTGVLYPKSVIVSRAFKCRLFLTCTLYLSYDLFHEFFLRTFKCRLFFTCILSLDITYHYVFVYKT